MLELRFNELFDDISVGVLKRNYVVEVGFPNEQFFRYMFGIIVYKLVTSFETSITSFGSLVFFSVKYVKFVVSLRHDFYCCLFG